MATRFADEGMKVVLADIEEGPLADAEKRLADGGAAVLAVPTDVTKAAQVDALADQTFGAFGTAHIVCNNAGVATGGPMWTLTEADWQWVLGVIREERFYILTHPEMTSMVQHRMEDVVDGRNPAPSFFGA